jgi:hypothetical protein
MRRKKGDIESVRLGDLENVPRDLADVVVRIRHDGPGVTRQWAFELQALRLEELRRVVEARAGLTPDVAPELWDGLKDADGKIVVHGVRDAKGQIRIVTPEGMRRMLELAAKIVGEVAVGIEGTELPIASDGPSVAAELARLGAIEAVMQAAMEVQSLTKAERFPAADPRDAR